MPQSHHPRSDLPNCGQGQCLPCHPEHLAHHCLQTAHDLHPWDCSFCCSCWHCPSQHRNPGLPGCPHVPCPLGSQQQADLSQCLQRLCHWARHHHRSTAADSCCCFQAKYHSQPT